VDGTILSEFAPTYQKIVILNEVKDLFHRERDPSNAQDDTLIPTFHLPGTISGREKEWRTACCFMAFESLEAINQPAPPGMICY